MPETALCVPHAWELAEAPALREEVYRFRYTQYFRHLPEAEWLDHAQKRVYAPHDDHSVHLVARNAAGDMIAVGSGTGADAGDLPAEWLRMLHVERLRALDLSKILIYSRLVELPHCRSSPLFLHFFQYAARLFVERGFAHTIHYSPPALVAMYERLGYRVYAEGFTLASGLYRIPMILVAADAAHLARVHPAFSEAIRGRAPAGDPELAHRLLPELLDPPLCARGAPGALAHARALCRADDAQRMIPTEAARAISRSALLRLRAGDAPVHAGDVPLLWFVLAGTCRVRCQDGDEERAEAGNGINGGCTFSALEDTTLLLFGRRAPVAGRQGMIPAPRFWKEVLAAQKH